MSLLNMRLILDVENPDLLKKIEFFTVYVHGDYLPENINNSTFIPCILANKNFASAFLFSQETQHTIG